MRLWSNAFGTMYLFLGLHSCFAGVLVLTCWRRRPGWEGGLLGLLPKLCVCSHHLAQPPPAPTQSLSIPQGLGPYPKREYSLLLSQGSAFGCRTALKSPAPREGLRAQGSEEGA